jgi:hypothetical protein
LPLEIDRTVSAEDIRKWNILDAIQDISKVWNSFMHTVIQNYFVQYCFGTAISVITNHENYEWVKATLFVPVLLMSFFMSTNLFYYWSSADKF